MKHISSYPSIYAIGHRAIATMFETPVTIEEKVDGSQFSFSVDADGEISCRSKGMDLVIDAPEKMFSAAVETVKALKDNLQIGWVYRGEYLSKPKHNTLAYSRHPDKHIVIFDIMTGVETYLSHDLKRIECERIGLECVPLIYEGMVASLDMFNGFLERESFLGGVKIEGVVVKNYNLFTPDKKIAIGKYVSEAFKEVHQKEWKAGNPTATDVVQTLIFKYKTPARWRKAVQHLRDAGQLTESPKDIGPLMVETVRDVEEECADEIKDALYKHFWPHIKRGLTGGLPEFYKQELAGNAFPLAPTATQSGQRTCDAEVISGQSDRPHERNDRGKAT